MLEKRVKRQLLDEVQSICPPHVTIMQVRQGLAKGLGHAVLCAHPVVGDEPVAVILPDVILDEYESDLSQDNLAEMIRRFDETGHSQIDQHYLSELVRLVSYFLLLSYDLVTVNDGPGDFKIRCECSQVGYFTCGECTETFLNANRTRRIERRHTQHFIQCDTAMFDQITHAFNHG